MTYEVILVDTSIWIDHLRVAELALARLLIESSVLGHPFIVGEIALETLRQRGLVLSLLRDLPQTEVAEHEEVLLLVERCGLAGTGIGHVDAHLLCATKLTAGARLWTRDKRLQAAAQALSIDYANHPSTSAPRPADT